MTGGQQNVDMQVYVEQAAAAGELVLQPRMGMATPAEMADGLRAVAAAKPRTVGTLTLDSYTRVGDHQGAARSLRKGEQLNGFPIVAHGPRVTARVAAAAGKTVPVQVRHGSSKPKQIFETMLRADLTASEGGPVSYCLPYGRTPLAESIRAWSEATELLAAGAQDRGQRAHLETFGGCMLGQLCPPSLLVALSVLEALFFTRHGAQTVSLSYAQQTDPVQDIEALVALQQLAAWTLPSHVDWHVVLYTYMGVYPRSEAGARLLLDSSAQIAVCAGAHRMVIKTAAEAHRIPSVSENVSALERADQVARTTRRESCPLPWADQVDYSEVLTEAQTLIHAVLNLSDDPGEGLRQAFASGVMDVPFCLHLDNRGQSQGMVTDSGRLAWARVGRMPLKASGNAGPGPMTSENLLRMLRFTADTHDHRALNRAAEPQPTLQTPPWPQRNLPS